MEANTDRDDGKKRILQLERTTLDYFQIKFKTTERQTWLATREWRDKEEKEWSQHTQKDRGLERAKYKLSFPFSFNLSYIFTHVQSKHTWILAHCIH